MSRIFALNYKEMSGFHVSGQKRIFRSEHRAASYSAASHHLQSGPSCEAQALGLQGRHHWLGREGSSS